MKRASQATTRSSRSAVLVATGILLSRLAGLVRLRVFAHYFGVQSEAADAFNAAFRIPNFLQNLFGEGALSASFIPVYSALVARDEREQADRVAGAVGVLLALLLAALVLVGVLGTPFLTDIIAPGFTGEKRELTIRIVRILFPGAALLVLSAWCLGILNSHRRFLLSYTAPVMWNVAMIASLLWFGRGSDLPSLALKLAWASVVGSALQLMVQIPAVLRLTPHLKLGFDAASEHVRTVVRNFAPVLISRGIVQISAFIDTVIASLLPTGAVTGIANAQLLYTLPVSLFGMSVSAAELPAMSGDAAIEGQGVEAVRTRLNAGLRRIAFFVVPSAMAFLALGDVIAGALLQTGRFREEDAVFVWAILAGSAVGLLASTLGRLYSSTYYALRDTKTPLRYALIRVGSTIVLGYVFAIHLPRWLAIPAIWGAAGITLAAGVAAWIEMLLLRSFLTSRIGHTGLPGDYMVKLWGAASVGAAVAWAIKLMLPELHPIAAAFFILGAYGGTFLALTLLLRIPESLTAFNRFVPGAGRHRD